jgi:hypothetical protein
MIDVIENTLKAFLVAGAQGKVGNLHAYKTANGSNADVVAY